MSRALAKVLLEPFSGEMTKSVEEVRSALETPPLRKIPLSEEHFRTVAGCELAFAMFKPETPEDRAVRISSPIQAAIDHCLRPASYAERQSSRTRQSHWDLIFCNLWSTLLDLAGIASLRYSRHSSASSSSSSSRSSRSSVPGSRSFCSLLVHGKEVFYGEEDWKQGSDTGEQMRKKLKGFLDPKYFLDMSHMICYATENLTLR